jgi:hypothetical protein
MKQNSIWYNKYRVNPQKIKLESFNVFLHFNWIEKKKIECFSNCEPFFKIKSMRLSARRLLSGAYDGTQYDKGIQNGCTLRTLS